MTTLTGCVNLLFEFEELALQLVCLKVVALSRPSTSVAVGAEGIPLSVMVTTDWTNGCKPLLGLHRPKLHFELAYTSNSVLEEFTQNCKRDLIVYILAKTDTVGPT